MARRYWLMKTEPGTFSIDDLAARPGRRAFWDGVRNYQARNLLRDEVRVGDGVLVYHSGIPAPAVAGTATVVGAAAPDPSQFDPRSPHHDPGAAPAAPRWYGVEIEFEQGLPPSRDARHAARDPWPRGDARPAPRQPPLGDTGPSRGVVDHRHLRRVSRLAGPCGTW